MQRQTQAASLTVTRTLIAHCCHRDSNSSLAKILHPTVQPETFSIYAITACLFDSC